MDRICVGVVKWWHWIRSKVFLKRLVFCTCRLSAERPSSLLGECWCFDDPFSTNTAASLGQSDLCIFERGCSQPTWERLGGREPKRANLERPRVPTGR